MNESTSDTTTAKARVALGFALWLVAALAVGASGVLSIDRRGLIPLILLGSTVVLVVLGRGRGPLGVIARNVDPRLLILFHGIRAPIGASFLVLAATDRLDPVFASVAGWGDILVGLTAPLAAAGGMRPGRAWTWVRLAWNALGLADILVVVVIAQSILIASGHPETMAELLTIPWLVIPLFIVPIVFATHGLLFTRLRATRETPTTGFAPAPGT